MAIFDKMNIFDKHRQMYIRYDNWDDCYNKT